MKKINWKNFDRGMFLLNVLGIVYDPKTKLVLIGRRKNDPYFPKISWTFSGGRPSHNEELENALKREIKKKTNLDVKIKGMILARTYKEDRRFLSLYYLVEPLNAGKEKSGEKFVEIKWVKPKHVTKYLKYPSMDRRIVKFLKELDKRKSEI